MASRFELSSKLEDRQPLIARIYTNFSFFVFRYAQNSKRDNHELHEFTRILASSISLCSKKVKRRKAIKSKGLLRFSLSSKLEDRQPLIARIYTNFGFLHFALLNARRKRFLLAVLSAREISREAELHSK